MNDGNWQVSEVERVANEQARQGMRVMVWVLGPVALAVVCFLLGLVAGR